MDATLILIDSDAEFGARSLIGFGNRMMKPT
jgi:hypothetical protein